MATNDLCTSDIHEKHPDHKGNNIEIEKLRDDIIVPSRKTNAQSTGGSIPSHGELLKVTDHSQCM